MIGRPSGSSVVLYSLGIGTRSLHPECSLDVPTHSGFFQDLRDTRQADDEEAACHFGRGPKDQGSEVVYRVESFAVLDCDGESEGGGDAGPGKNIS